MIDDCVDIKVTATNIGVKMDEQIQQSASSSPASSEAAIDLNHLDELEDGESEGEMVSETSLTLPVSSSSQHHYSTNCYSGAGSRLNDISSVAAASLQSLTPWPCAVDPNSAAISTSGPCGFSLAGMFSPVGGRQQQYEGIPRYDLSFPFPSPSTSYHPPAAHFPFQCELQRHSSLHQSPSSRYVTSTLPSNPYATNMMTCGLAGSQAVAGYSHITGSNGAMHALAQLPQYHASHYKMMFSQPRQHQFQHHLTSASVGSKSTLASTCHQQLATGTGDVFSYGQCVTSSSSSTPQPSARSWLQQVKGQDKRSETSHLATGGSSSPASSSSHDEVKVKDMTPTTFYPWMAVVGKSRSRDYHMIGQRNIVTCSKKLVH